MTIYNPPLDPFRALTEGNAKIQFRIVEYKYSEQDRSRISGYFVLYVIALILLTCYISYRFHIKSDTTIVIPLFVLVGLSYRIMNKKLTTYVYAGKAILEANQIIFYWNNEEFQRIPYNSIRQITSEPGVPFQVFKSKGQQKEYHSLDIRFDLIDGSLFQSKLSTEGNIDNEHVKYTPTLEECFSFLYPSYCVIDKSLLRFSNILGKRL